MKRGGFVEAIERFFRLSEHGTTVRTEVLGGATTFATMVLMCPKNGMTRTASSAGDDKPPRGPVPSPERTLA